MSRIHVNLLSPPRRWGSIAGRLLLLLACLGALALAWQDIELRRSLNRGQDEWQQLNKHVTQANSGGNAEDREKLTAELRAAALVVDRLDRPWDQLFQTIEAISGEDATLLSVDPDRDRHELRLTAEARDPKAMLSYLRRLRESPTLQNAHLISHQVNVQDPQRPIRFSLEATWAELDEPRSPPAATTTDQSAEPSL